MSGAPTGKQSKRELTTARTLNTVATIGAMHPLYTATRKLGRDTGAGRQIGRLVPTKTKEAAAAASNKVKQAVAGNRVTRSAAGFAGRHVKGAAIAAGTGWIGFHGAELAGDVMARRSINRQLKQHYPEKEAAVKAYQTPVDFSKAANRGSGHGVNLAKRDTRETAGMVGGAAVGGSLSIKGTTAANRAYRAAANDINDRRAKNPAGRSAKFVQWATEHPKAYRAGVVGAVRSPIVVLPIAGGAAGGALLKRRKAKPQPFPVMASKRYFDPEADRQRRLGLYAGLGGGSALVLGEATRRQFTGNVERHPVQGKQKRGRLKNVTVGLKQGKRLRTPAMLGGAAALSAIGGAAAYKHGISERNRPYS